MKRTKKVIVEKWYINLLEVFAVIEFTHLIVLAMFLAI